MKMSSPSGRRSIPWFFPHHFNNTYTTYSKNCNQLRWYIYLNYIMCCIWHIGARTHTHIWEDISSNFKKAGFNSIKTYLEKKKKTYLGKLHSETLFLPGNSGVGTLGEKASWNSYENKRSSIKRQTDNFIHWILSPFRNQSTIFYIYISKSKLYP